MIFFSADLTFIPKVFIQCKKAWGLGSRVEDHEFWFIPSKFYSDVTYYFWLSSFCNVALRHNPYIMKLVSLEFLVQIRRHLNIVTRNRKMEAQTKLAVLRIYVENRSILEPICLYHASKYKNTKEQGSKNCLWIHIFTFLCDYYKCFFFFLSKCKYIRIH